MCLEPAKITSIKTNGIIKIRRSNENTKIIANIDRFNMYKPPTRLYKNRANVYIVITTRVVIAKPCEV
jgi:hypothetical protein